MKSRGKLTCSEALFADRKRRLMRSIQLSMPVDLIVDNARMLASSYSPSLSARFERWRYNNLPMFVLLLTEGKEFRAGATELMAAKDHLDNLDQIP